MNEFKRHCAPLAGMLAFAVGIAIMAVRAFVVSERERARLAAQQVVRVSPSIVIGHAPAFRGAETAAYTLVEFGDYECPPCRVANNEMRPMLDNVPNAIRFEFRNYPLEGIHRWARRAAIAAECARTYGKYWEVHDALYSTKENGLDGTAIRAALASENLAMQHMSRKCVAAAQSRLAADIRDGRRLGVQGTPTFFLCLSIGKVIKLRGLGDPVLKSLIP